MNATRTLSALTVSACALVAPAASQSMTAAPAPSDAETIQARTLRVGDRDRTVAYYVPAGSRREAALLIVLHGSQMTGATMRRATAQRFDRLADREGFVVAYPDALDRIWADCRPQSAWQRRRSDPGAVARGTPMVALITIDGGGHTVPQPSYTFPADLGATSSFDAPAAAWAFFTAR